MAETPQFDNPLLDPRLREYHARLNDLTNSTLAGELPRSSFQRELTRTVNTALLAAFVLAGGDAQAASRRLAAEIRIHTRAIRRLGNDLYNGRYSEIEGQQTADEGREKLDSRLTLWVTSLAGSWTLGQVFNTESERLYYWRLGFTEHCVSCFSGAEKGALTAAQWAGLGLWPQSRGLRCGGYRCQCSLVEVTL